MYINREPELILNPVPSFLHKGWERQKEYMCTYNGEQVPDYQGTGFPSNGVY